MSYKTQMDCGRLINVERVDSTTTYRSHVTTYTARIRPICREHTLEAQTHSHIRFTSYSCTRYMRTVD